jgi:hypothetical protein
MLKRKLIRGEFIHDLLSVLVRKKEMKSQHLLLKTHSTPFQQTIQRMILKEEIETTEISYLDMGTLVSSILTKTSFSFLEKIQPLEDPVIFTELLLIH